MAESPSSALPGGVEWLPALGGAHLLRAELGRGEPPALILQSALGVEHRIEPGPEARFSRTTDYLVPAGVRWSVASLLWPDGTRALLPNPPGERAEVIALPTRRLEPPPEPQHWAAPPPEGTPEPPPRGASDATGAAAGWRSTREVLQHDLVSAAEAVLRARESERATGEAVLAVLAGAHADLQAVRAARAADAALLATLADQLEAERTTHASEIAELRAELERARQEAALLRADLERGGTRTRVDLQRLLATQAEAAATAPRRPPEDSTRLIAALDAAASSLRAIVPAPPEATAAESVPATSGNGSPAAAPPESPAAHAPEDPAAAAPPESPAARVPEGLAAAPPEAPLSPAARLASPAADAPGSPATASPPEASPGVFSIAAAAPDSPAPTVPVGSAAAAPPESPVAAPQRSEPPSSPAEAPESPGAAPRESHAAGTPDTPSAVAESRAADTPKALPVAAAPESLAPGASQLQTRVESAPWRLTAAPVYRAPLVVAEVARPGLRQALVALAREDTVAASALLAGLLPAQGPLLGVDVSYDLTVRGFGTFAVTVRDGSARVQRIARRRPRREAAFHLAGEPLVLAELLAGEQRRIKRFGRGLKVNRRRKRVRVLAALPKAPLSLADAVTAGARLEPSLVYRALPFAVAPEWTRGHVFTVAQEIVELAPRAWYVTARDGVPLTVVEHAAGAAADATVTMSLAAFDRLLRGEPAAEGDRPVVRGDRAAVATLKRWTELAAGA